MREPSVQPPLRVGQRMITHTGMDVNAYTQQLQQLITANHMTASGNPADWRMNRTRRGRRPGSTMAVYWTMRITTRKFQVVDKRLALAGLRLAALLEEYSAGSQRRGQRHES